MKRIKIFAAIVVTFLAVNVLTVNTAKAQVGVHVGFNFGAPAYYPPAPAYDYGYYGPRYYHHAYYGPRFYHEYYGPRYYPAPVYRHSYYRGYRRW